jgi:hypothetical protein
MTQSSSPAQYKWCCIASSSPSTKEIALERVNGYDNETDYRQSGYLREVNDHLVDVTMSPDWMEFIESSEARMNDSGGAGAYDTYRCDFILGFDDTVGTDRWRIWGQDFHLNRLQESYRSILPNTAADSSIDDDRLKKPIQAALRMSKMMVQALLGEAEKASILKTAQTMSGSSWEDVCIQMVKVTLLWSPSHQGEDSHEIVVRAHACSSAIPFAVNSSMQPIQVAVAAKHQPTQESVSVDESMPTRLHDPQHKIASWTRLRKEMERPETYKPPGVSEVLMLRPTEVKGEAEVLEGLSSNVFVVYSDGSLRTAQDGVLFGYARHLVLEAAAACGLKLGHNIVLQDAKKGLWKEAFITSSSRLIFPISSVLVHTENENEFVEYWCDPVLSNETSAPIDQKPKWKQLLDEILRKGGYTHASSYQPDSSSVSIS